jgi:hypothetical protein
MARADHPSVPRSDTPAAVLAAADDPDPVKQTGHVCEANFFRGEWALRNGAKDEARRLFLLAATACPKSFIQWALQIRNSRRSGRHGDRVGCLGTGQRRGFAIRGAVQRG